MPAVVTNSKEVKIFFIDLILILIFVNILISLYIEKLIMLNIKKILKKYLEDLIL